MRDLYERRGLDRGRQGTTIRPCALVRSHWWRELRALCLVILVGSLGAGCALHDPPRELVQEAPAAERGLHGGANGSEAINESNTTSTTSATNATNATELGWTAGTILNVKTRQAVALDPWLSSLGQADVIYIGEEHHNREHIQAAQRIMTRLVEQGRRPVIGMEMFSWDGQAALDRQVSEQPMPVPTFLDAAHWSQNWGGDFDDYAPLVQFAHQQQLQLKAWNAPRPLVRKVARQGLAQALEDPEVREWGMSADEIVEDEPYRAIIVDQLQACHGGGEARHYLMMYEASLFRDESMAKTVTQAYREVAAAVDSHAGPIVSYTGSGHIQYGLPIPQRVARRVGSNLKQVTVYLASYEPSRTDEIREWLDGAIADFIWLTPVGRHGPPQRCR